MATRIRLRRMGRKKQPSYRIVVADRAAARNGRFIETLGHYDPLTQPVTVTVDAARARHWLDQGASPSDTVRSLLRKAGVFSPAGAAETAATPEVAGTPATEEPAAASAEAPAAPPADAEPAE